MASCTAVSVRLRGRFCVCDVRERLERFGRGRMRRAARIRTCRSENFFSSSRVRLFVLLLADGSSNTCISKARGRENDDVYEEN